MASTRQQIAAYMPWQIAATRGHGYATPAEAQEFLRRLKRKYGPPPHLTTSSKAQRQVTQ